jgi:hypothetical protein
MVSQQVTGSEEEEKEDQDCGTLSFFSLSLSCKILLPREDTLGTRPKREKLRRIQQIQVEKKRASPFTTVVEAVAVEEQQSERAQSIYNTSSTLYLSLSLSALLSSPCL